MTEQADDLECDETLNTSSETEQNQENVFKDDPVTKQGLYLFREICFYAPLILVWDLFWVAHPLCLKTVTSFVNDSQYMR